MPGTVTFAQAAEQCRSAGKNLEKAQNAAVRVGAIAAKRAIEYQLVAAGVHDGRLRGVGKNGAAIGVGIVPAKDGITIVKGTGPIWLLENDNRKHVIGNNAELRAIRAVGAAIAGKKLRRKRSSKVLTIGGVGSGFAAFVKHPGTRGKQPFAKGEAVAAVIVPPIVQAEIRGAVFGAFL